MSYRSHSLNSFELYTFARATQVPDLLHLWAKASAIVGSMSVLTTVHATDHDVHLLLSKAAALRASALTTWHAIDHDSYRLLLRAAALQA